MMVSSNLGHYLLVKGNLGFYHRERRIPLALTLSSRGEKEKRRGANKSAH